jgi:hypothetical protein
MTDIAEYGQANGDPMPRGWARGLSELAPMLRRIEVLDSGSAVRLRVEPGTDPAVTAFVNLPFGVLVSRTIQVQRIEEPAAVNRTSTLSDLVAWLLGEGPEPARRDELWRSGLPPAVGWRRLDAVADSIIRDCVRDGALAVRDLGDQAGEGEQVRQPAIEALLDSVVLTVSSDQPGEPVIAPIPLRTLSALTRMGFLARDSQVGVDVCRGWIRVTGRFGAAYAMNASAPGPSGPRGLGLLPILR